MQLSDLFRGFQNCFKNLCIPGTATDVPAECVSEFLFTPLDSVDEYLRCHDETRRAETALIAARLNKRLRTGWSSPSLAKPSMVVISFPETVTPSTIHDVTALPSTITVHAPQSPVLHPSFVPVRPIVSRRTANRVLRGSTSRSCSSPLTISVTGCFAIFFSLTYTFHVRYEYLFYYALARAKAFWTVRFVRTLTISLRCSAEHRKSDIGLHPAAAASPACSSSSGVGSLPLRRFSASVARSEIGLANYPGAPIRSVVIDHYQGLTSGAATPMNAKSMTSRILCLM